MKNRFARSATSSHNIPPPNRFASSASPSSNGNVKKRDYFDDSDTDDSPRPHQSNAGADDDYDPLDDYMNTIQEQVAKDNAVRSTPLPEIVSQEVGDMDDEYVSRRSKPGEAALDLDEYSDSERNNLKSRLIEPLPAVDHSAVKYAPFTKGFYKESPELASLSADDVAAYRDELEVHVPYHHGEVVRPLKSFKQAGFDSLLLKEIEKVGYTAPTPIQAQTLPLAMSGRDVLGLAKTGSGKTLAYVWPIIVHILHQPQMQLGEGPIALVLAPTRELAAQIHSEARKYCRLYNIQSTAVYGGAGKFEMMKSLKESPELVIATPGRMIEMVKNRSTNLGRCTLAVLDEADRMFEMGFEYQMRSIMQHIRPHDRQVLMFSATMKKRIESFARDILNKECVRVVVGSIGMANPDIQQVALLLPGEELKYSWLTSHIEDFVAEGKVLIFVLNKANTELLARSLGEYFVGRRLSVNVDCLHGDKDQSERAIVMARFKQSTLYSQGGASSAPASASTKEISILIATDIAARGLDVKDIRTVINFDVAKNIDTYVHRIGRTGRMGQEGVIPGTAYTLLTPKDAAFAVDLVHNLDQSKQPVPPEVQRLAESDPKWRRHGIHVSVTGGHRPGSGGHANGGIGFSGGANPAVYGGTSAMAAQSSRAVGAGMDAQFSAAVLKAYDRGAFERAAASAGPASYLEQGRSEPWPAAAATAAASNSVAAAAASAPTGGEPSAKRSRFSDKILPGLVKSSGTVLGTVSEAPPKAAGYAPVVPGDADARPSERKSRWDA